MNRKPNQLTEAQFLRDVAEHVLTIEHDHGLHRRLICAKPGTQNQRYELITWPGELCFTGDMGTYVFERLRDMFEFFRSPSGVINPPYWSEKVTAECRTGGVLRFCDRTFRHRVVEEFRDYWRTEIESEGRSQALYERRRECWDELRADVLCHDDETLARHALYDFQCEGLRFDDSCEWDLSDFSYHFLWACHAIVWAIQQYDAAKAQAVAA